MAPHKQFNLLRELKFFCASKAAGVHSGRFQRADGQILYMQLVYSVSHSSTFTFNRPHCLEKKSIILGNLPRCFVDLLLQPTFERALVDAYSCL